VFEKLTAAIRRFHHDLRFRVAKWLAIREVTRVLKVTHAQELALLPRAEWPLAMSRQRQEIQAVAGGQIDIVDRRTWAYPALPEALHRLNQPLTKNQPYALRKFSETPIPRRAINLIKNGILSRDWEVRPVKDRDDMTPEREKRIRIATECLKRPNNDDSFRDVFEAFIEDLIVTGAGVAEPRMTPWFQRPFKMWSVDSQTISRFLDYSEATPDRPKWAQRTGLRGEKGIVAFYANELMYVRDNVRTHTPFGLGCLEVAFNTVNALLNANENAARAGADQVHKSFLWWENTVNPVVIQQLRRYLTNEQEGQLKISPVAGAKKPEVIDIQATTPDDLLIDWQEFLIRIIANAFDLSPLSLGLERDVNRNTGEVMTDSDFRNCVVPRAKRIAEAITRHILHGFLGWRDLEFAFMGLDDPSIEVQTTVQKAEWTMNAITPDEIRAKKGDPPLPGGWGRLNFGQYAIILAAVSAKMKGQQPGAGKGAGGAAVPGGGGAPGGAGMPSMGGTPSAPGGGGGLSFAAEDIAQMSPEDISLYQELGILPPGSALLDQMEQEHPGILEQVTDELTEFFDKLKESEEQADIQPSPITTDDQKRQKDLFKRSQHVETDIERTVNRGTPDSNGNSNGGTRSPRSKSKPRRLPR
jgi:hypothetical protein